MVVCCTVGVEVTMYNGACEEGGRLRSCWFDGNFWAGKCVNMRLGEGVRALPNVCFSLPVA